MPYRTVYNSFDDEVESNSTGLGIAYPLEIAYLLNRPNEYSQAG